MFRASWNKVAAIACMALAGSAFADAYPSRPVTIVIPVAAGGTTDIAGRALAKQLKDELGQPVVIDNKPGASGGIANSAVARANPDGYSLVLSYEGFHAGNPVMQKNLSWNPVTDFTPIAEVIRGPHLMLVPANSPAKTLREFIELAKQKPGKLNYGSSGNGSIQHLGAELLQLKTGTKMVHVPYGGAAPAMQDLLAGRIDLFITTPPTAMGHLEAGKLRALAITSEQRHPSLPNIPTTAEAGLPDFKLDAWFSLFGPANMPQPVVDKLAAAVKKVVTSAEFGKAMSAQGSTASYRSPAELRQILKDDLAKWGDVVKAANIKVD